MRFASGDVVCRNLIPEGQFGEATQNDMWEVYTYKDGWSVDLDGR